MRVMTFSSKCFCSGFVNLIILSINRFLLHHDYLKIRSLVGNANVKRCDEIATMYSTAILYFKSN
jgi:hypothetical protein